MFSASDSRKHWKNQYKTAQTEFRTMETPIKVAHMEPTTLEKPLKWHTRTLQHWKKHNKNSTNAAQSIQSKQQQNWHTRSPNHCRHQYNDKLLWPHAWAEMIGHINNSPTHSSQNVRKHIHTHVHQAGSAASTTTTVLRTFSLSSVKHLSLLLDNKFYEPWLLTTFHRSSTHIEINRIEFVLLLDDSVSPPVSKSYPNRIRTEMRDTAILSLNRIGTPIQTLNQK